MLGFAFLVGFSPSKVSVSLLTVAVATENIALGDFTKNSSPRITVLDHTTNGRFFVGSVAVVEL